MSRKQYETEFLTMLRKSFLYYDMRTSYWYKIPDDRKFKKPYDVIASFRGIPMVIETKVHKKETAWPLSDVKEHQGRGLLKAAQGGYLAFVMLHIHNKENNVCVVIPIQDFEQWKVSGLKSAKVIDLLENKCFYREKIKELDEYLWNITDWNPKYY